MSQATMLLRSSSTPVLGSLLSSFSDSANNSSSNHHHDINTAFKHSPIHHQSINKLPYHQTGCFCLSTISCNSSPISPSISEFSGRSHQGFRRAQSEGNLQRILDYSSNNNDEQHYNPNQTRKVSGRSKCLMLETIPSFSFSTLRGRYEDEDEEDEDQSDVQDEEERAELDENAAAENGHFGLSNKTENMVLTEEVRVMDRIWSVNFEEKREWISEEMHLARGPGIDCGSNGNGGGGGYGGRSGGGSGDEFDSGGGDMHGTEEYYKRMVQENPGNPLFLRNYAQFLYQTKRDLQGAEEYYSRAILADPKDGEILSQYGKLVWELHQDQDRASSYFERGVQASPEDCHVHAAYASFLWETEHDDGDDDVECKVPPKDFDAKPPHFHEGEVAFARG
ncbi:PREDICTED: uncharacterized protein LOC105125639 [Populus euphratica]|uniref:Uncharacterized protein LOC105125639 n=1 Tax=Populus euphratica TaxID=75702 RepID=A0AAJ6U7Z7_POPEU|nr:PREDICTED: uncharacterized protein LOC105125639 [Populus euphratica]